MRLGVVVLVALAACQPPPNGPISLPLADAASLRLRAVPSGDDLTFHIPLQTGFAQRIRLGLFAASGREITPPLHPVNLSFSFVPATLATATVVDSTLLVFELSAADTAGTEGGLRITLTEPATGTTKSFGPFDILVH